MPFPDPELAARYASMQKEQSAHQRMVRNVSVPGWQAEGEVLPAPTAQEGGFDIYHPYAGTEQITYKSKSGKVSLVSPGGEHVMVPEAEAQAYADKGYQAEAPADYWSRKESESRDEAAGQAFMGSFVSGLTFGGSDAILEQRYGKAAAAREADIRGRNPGMSTFGEVTGAVAGMALGPVDVAGQIAGKALGGLARAGAYGGRFVGMTAKAAETLVRTERAAYRAARLGLGGGEKEAANVARELAHYKAMPTTGTEKVALQAEIATETAPAKAAATATETAAEPVTAMVRQGDTGLASLDETTQALIRAATGPNREGRLAPKAVEKAVKDLPIPSADKADLAEWLKIERGIQSKTKWWDDTISGISEKMRHAKATEKEAELFRRWEHDWERLLEQQAELVGRRSAAGRAPSSSDLGSILETFGAQGGPPALPAHIPERAAAFAAPAAAKAEAKATLTAELEQALEAGRMPDFLQTRAGAPRGPVMPGYTRARGAEWLAGGGAPKTSSRTTPGERWGLPVDPKSPALKGMTKAQREAFMAERIGWNVPGKGAPRFPGGGIPDPGPTTLESMLDVGGAAMRRGGAEGGLYAGGRELSRQALEGGDYDPVAVAAHAVQGAALGSLVSLAGAGITSVAGRASQGLRRAVLNKAGVDSTRLDVLLARERLVRARLEFLREDPTRQAVEGELRAIKGQIFQARGQIFEEGGKLLKSMAVPLGAVGGVGSGSLVGMLLGHAGAHGAARILTSGIVKRVGIAAMRGAGTASKTVPWLGKIAGLTIVDTMTDEEAQALAVQLEQTDAQQVGMAAMQGYKVAGIDPRMATFLADFQAKRVEILKLAITRENLSTGRVMATGILNAVEDPRRITARLAQGDVTNEDLMVLQILFPDFYKDLSYQATQLLKRPGLTARQKLDLQKVAGNATYAISTDAIQTAIKPAPPETGQPGRKSFKTDSAATESQRIQGEKS